MNLVFIRICLCGYFLASLIRRRHVAGESSVAKQQSHFVFPRFDFREGVFGQEVRVESRDDQPVDVIVSCPRERSATQSTVTVQPNETMNVVLHSSCEASSPSKNSRGLELTSNGSVGVYVYLTKSRRANTTRKIARNAQVSLIPTSRLGISYLLYPPLAVNTSPRSVQLFLVAVHDNTSVTVIQAGAESTDTIQLDGFETFSINRTAVNATGIRIVSSKPVAAFVYDSSDENDQFSTNEETDELSAYFTVMQLTPENHWSKTYSLDLGECNRDRILVGIAAVSSNITKVRLKEKTADRVLTIAGNQMTHVFLTFNKSAAVVIEAEDKIQLLIYDDTRSDTQQDDDRSTGNTFVSVVTASGPLVPAQVLISACSTVADGSCFDGPGSDKRCPLAIRQEINLNEDGSTSKGTETGNKWVVKNRYNYTSSQPSAAARFYPAVLRALGAFPPSIGNTVDGRNTNYSPPSHRFNSYQIVPLRGPNLTHVLHSEVTTYPFRARNDLTEGTYGNRVSKDVDESKWETASQETDYKSSHNEQPSNRDWIYNTLATAVNAKNPGLAGSTMPAHQYDNATVMNITMTMENNVESTLDKIAQSSEGSTSVPSTGSNDANLTGPTASAIPPMTTNYPLKTPLKFIYRPYYEKDIRLALFAKPSDGYVSQATDAPFDIVSYRTTNNKTKGKQKVVHKALSMFVVKQDVVDKAGHKVVNYFQIDAAQVDQYSSQEKGISPTVIAVITSLCGAVFFVVACILGFVITEVLCAKGKLQRAKVSPCIDISNSGY